MKILITNDDGIHSRGLNVLVEKLRSEHDILIVGPDSERSATSHSVTIHERILVREVEVSDKFSSYAVQGTPADCVKWAVSESGFKPDWVVSGINRGANTGISVIYSGTVAAAREGVINGISAMAVSLCSKTFSDFQPGADWVAKLLKYFGKSDSAAPLLLNISIPPRAQNEIKGLKLARVAHSRFIEEFVRHHPDQLEAESKVRHYELAGGIHLLSPDGTSDEELVRLGWVTLSPLVLDQMDHNQFNFLKENLDFSKLRF